MYTLHIVYSMCKPVDSAEVDVYFFVCMQRLVLHTWGLSLTFCAVKDLESRRWGSVGKALLLLALHEDLGH